jgi:hypothetical protein
MDTLQHIVSKLYSIMSMIIFNIRDEVILML